MIAPKQCALVAAGGFVLSALIGLISGNLGPLMFVRALICGLVAGAVCLGVSVVFSSVLATATNAGAPGSTVDISVDDESFLDGDEEASFDLGNLLEDGEEKSPQFEEARAAINAIPSRGVERENVTEKPVAAADKPAEADKPVFTAKPLVATAQKRAPELDKMDPAIAAETIRSMLRTEQ